MSLLIFGIICGLSQKVALWPTRPYNTAR